MSTKLKEYSWVRIVKLAGKPDDPRYNTIGSYKREPQVGDVGFLMHTFHKDGIPDQFLVDFSLDIEHQRYGSFLEEELEPKDDKQTSGMNE
jgi:hypothetical protein